MIPASSRHPPSDAAVKRLVKSCPKLASLGSVHAALAELLRNQNSRGEQYADIIARDASLTERLLRMVNSVYFGLGSQVGKIQEAVLYLGLRQVRSLALSTPILEDLAQLGSGQVFIPWRDFWLQSLACAFATRDILSQTEFGVDDDTDYIAGLLHNVGRVVIAKVFPVEFSQLISATYASEEEMLATERQLLGWDHAAIGAYYLERHHISAAIVDAVRYHHNPAASELRPHLAASAGLAEVLVRQAGLSGGLEKRPLPTPAELAQHPATALLWGTDPSHQALQLRILGDSVRQLPQLVEALL